MLSIKQGFSKIRALRGLGFAGSKRGLKDSFQGVSTVLGLLAPYYYGIEKGSVL